MPKPHRLRAWLPFWLLAAAACSILALDLASLFPADRHFAVSAAELGLFSAAGAALVHALRLGRVTAAADLTAERDMLVDLMQSVPDGIALWDADGTLQAYNDIFLRKRRLPDAVRPGLAYRDFVANALTKGRVADDGGDKADYLTRRLAAFAAADGTPHEIAKNDGAIEEVRFYRARGGGVVAVYRDVTEFKRRAAELAAQRADFSEILETLPDGLMLWDAEGRLTAFNQAIVRLRAGFQPTLIGVRFEEFARAGIRSGNILHTAGSDEDALAALLAEHADPKGIPREVARADGRWDEIRKFKTKNGGVVSIYRDITARKRAEADLERERERSADILAAIPDGIVLWDADNRLATLNPSAARMQRIGGIAEIGIDYAEFARRSLAENPAIQAVDRPLPDLAERMANHANPTGEPQEFQYRDGNWLEVRKFRARDGGVVAVYRDVTERKRGEVELERQKGRLADIMDAIPDGIILWDGEYRLVAANAAAANFRPKDLILTQGIAYADYMRELADRSGASDPAGARTVDFATRISEHESPTGTPNEFPRADGSWEEVRKFRARDGGVVTLFRDVTERKRGEAELQRQKDRLADIMDSIPDGIVLWDGERRFVAANAAALRFRANDPPLVPGIAYPDYMRELVALGTIPDMLGGGQAYLKARLAEHDSPSGVPLEFPRADGTWEEIRKFRARDGGVVTLYRDVTERKLGEAELQRQRRLLQEIMDAIPDGLQVWGPDGRLVAFNGRAAAQRAGEAPLIPGITYADFIRRVTYSGSIPEIAGNEEAHIARQIRDHAGSDSYSREVERVDGRWEEVRKVATSDGGRLSLLRDVTQRKRAEAELERQRRLLQEIMDALPDGLQLWGADGKLAAFNRKAAEQRTDAVALTLGIDYADFIRRSAYSGSIPEFVGDEEAYIAMRLADHANPQAQARNVLRADGRWEEVRKVATSDGGRLGLFRDITAEKRALAERDSAEAASRAKTEFLAMMSHELRTPMNGVIATTGLLARTRLGDEQRLFLDTIQRSAQSLLTIIDDVLDWAKLEEGRIEIDPVDCAPGQIADNVVSLLRPAAAQKGIALKLEFDPALPEFGLIDPARLRQILLNLVGNAVKFTAQGGVTVRLAAEPAAEGHMLSLEVTDTGIGIAPEALPKLFDRFTQADGSIARRYGGTGLGLAIAKRLLDLMGGSIDVVSRPGAGSRFVIRLPMAPGRRPVGTAAPLLPAPTRTLKLLVAEDNAINRMVVEHLLRELGHTAEFAVDGAEAVSKARADDYDAILMDVQMPDTDGIKATRLIRALDGPRARVPIVALTANALAGDRERYLDAGMDDYVSKPIDAYALAAALARIDGAPAPESRAKGAPRLRQTSEPHAAGKAALAGLVEALRRANANSG